MRQTAAKLPPYLGLPTPSTFVGGLWAETTSEKRQEIRTWLQSACDFASTTAPFRTRREQCRCHIIKMEPHFGVKSFSPTHRNVSCDGLLAPRTLTSGPETRSRDESVLVIMRAV